MSGKNNDWVTRLLQPSAFAHPVRNIRLVETHISWLILTGDFAYKIKKPVDHGFANFSTLQRRKLFCEEELRLNRRLAPDLYLRVAEITGSHSSPKVDGDGPVIDYAVVMQQFDNDLLLSCLAGRAELKPEHVDQLADLAGLFHLHADSAAGDSSHASIQKVIEPARENFSQLRELLGSRCPTVVDELERWTIGEFQRLEAVFQERAARGMIRECHGDMHLANMFVDISGQVTVFDGIDFNEDLRWIDIISETAFTMMDLEDRGYRSLAWRYLNRWLEITGDYEGLQVLRFYLVYRAVVRAKVDLIRSHQPGVAPDLQSSLDTESVGYLKLAQSYTQRGRALLAITCGLSGSGKTTGTQSAIEELALVRVRSDVERKRLAGLGVNDRSKSAADEGIYRAEFTRAVYQRLLELAAKVIQSGISVVVDATFSELAERRRFADLSHRLHVPLIILHFDVAPELLKERVRSRMQDGRDASEATEEIVALQQDRFERLTSEELACAVDATTVDLVNALRN